MLTQTAPLPTHSCPRHPSEVFVCVAHLTEVRAAGSLSALSPTITAQHSASRSYLGPSPRPAPRVRPRHSARGQPCCPASSGAHVCMSKSCCVVLPKQRATDSPSATEMAAALKRSLASKPSATSLGRPKRNTGFLPREQKPQHIFTGKVAIGSVFFSALHSRSRCPLLSPDVCCLPSFPAPHATLSAPGTA